MIKLYKKIIELLKKQIFLLTKKNQLLLIELLKKQIFLLTKKNQLLLEEKRQAILKTAKRNIGKDVSPIYDDLGCAESVNFIVERATGKPIGGGVSTYLMYQELKKHHRKTTKPKGGDIVISPSGYCSKFKHGHVGIMLDNVKIMSNDSATSLWKQNYTTQTWFERYKMKGRCPVLYFRLYK